MFILLKIKENTDEMLCVGCYSTLESVKEKCTAVSATGEKMALYNINLEQYRVELPFPDVNVKTTTPHVTFKSSITTAFPRPSIGLQNQLNYVSVPPLPQAVDQLLE